MPGQIIGKDNGVDPDCAHNGSSFDLPVLRYRAMVHGVAAPGLTLRSYFNRYTDKPDGISGGEVEKYYRDGQARASARPRA